MSDDHCGCVFPSGPHCDTYTELLRDVGAAYSDVLDATDAYFESRDEYGREEAKADLREAEDRHGEARRALLDHRLAASGKERGPRRGRAAETLEVGSFSHTRKLAMGAR